MKVNPKTISWTNPTSREDGTPYDAATENAGYELALANPAGGALVPFISIPLAFGTSFDVSSAAAYQALPSGQYEFALAVTSKEGLSSKYSNRTPFQVAAVPSAPVDLVVA